MVKCYFENKAHCREVHLVLLFPWIFHFSLFCFHEIMKHSREVNDQHLRSIVYAGIQHHRSRGCYSVFLFLVAHGFVVARVTIFEYLIPLILIIPSPCSPFCNLVSRGSMVNKYHAWPVSALVSIQIRLAVNFYPPSLPPSLRERAYQVRG